jgi:uncharacterized membrane protein
MTTATLPPHACTLCGRSSDLRDVANRRADEVRAETPALEAEEAPKSGLLCSARIILMILGAMAIGAAAVSLVVLKLGLALLGFCVAFLMMAFIGMPLILASIADVTEPQSH